MDRELAEVAEKPPKHRHHAFSIPGYRAAGYFIVVFCSSLSVVMAILIYLTLNTCGHPDRHCFSQFNFRITIGSNLGECIHGAISDIIDMLTFLVLEYRVADTSYGSPDFGVDAYDGHIIESTKDLPTPMLYQQMNYYQEQPSLETIGTFKPDTYFQLGFLGYCTTQTIKSCYGGINDGIDVASSIIRDVGTQLGDLKPNAGPKNIGDSLVGAYELLISSLRNNKDLKSTVDRVLGMKRISRCIPILMGIELSFHLLLVFLATAFLVLRMANLCYNYRHIKVLSWIFCVVCSTNLVVNITAVTLLAVYISIINQLLSEELSVAMVLFGKGFFLLVEVLVCSVVQTGFVLMAKTQLHS